MSPFASSLPFHASHAAHPATWQGLFRRAAHSRVYEGPPHAKTTRVREMSRAAGIVGENAASGTSSIVGETVFTESQYWASIRENALHGNLIRAWLSTRAPAAPATGRVEGFASAPRSGESGVVPPQTHGRAQMNRNSCLMNQKNDSRMRRCQHSGLTRLKPRLFSDTRAARGRPKGFRADGEETPPGQTPDLAYPKCPSRVPGH